MFYRSSSGSQVRRAGAALALVLFTLLVACSDSGSSEPPPLVVAEPATELEGRAKEFIDGLGEMRFDEVSAQLMAPTLASRIDIEQVWRSILDDAGDFRSVESIESESESEAEGMVILSLRVRFDDGAIPVRIALDGAMLVADIYFGELS